MTLTLTRTTPLHMPSRQAITSRCLQGAEHQLSPFCPTMVCARQAGPTQEWQLPCCHEEGAWRRLAGPIRLEHTPIYVRRPPPAAHTPLLLYYPTTETRHTTHTQQHTIPSTESRKIRTGDNRAVTWFMPGRRLREHVQKGSSSTDTPYSLDGMLKLVALFKEEPDAVHAAMACKHPDTVEMDSSRHHDDLEQFNEIVVKALDEVDSHHPQNSMVPAVVTDSGVNWHRVGSGKRHELTLKAFEELGELGYFDLDDLQKCGSIDMA